MYWFRALGDAFHKWHGWLLNTFPDYTPEQLVVKLQEEVAEFVEEPSLEEAVDVIVVAFYWCVTTANIARFVVAMDAKLSKNQQRVFERQTDGTYHHV